MNFSINPLTFQSMKIDNKKDQGIFLYNLGALLSQMALQINTLSSANGIAGVLNSGGAFLIQFFNTVTANPNNVNCAGVLSVFASLNMTTAFASPTLTLNNVPDGIPVMARLVNSTATTETFFLKCTTNAGAAATASAFTGTTFTDLSATGVSMAASAQLLFFGMMTSATARLFLVQT